MFSIFGLSDELSLNIFKLLAADELNNVCRVNRHSYQICEDYSLWVNKFVSIGVKSEIFTDEILKRTPKKIKQAFFHLRKHFPYIPAHQITIKHLIFATNDVIFIESFFSDKKWPIDYASLNIMVSCASRIPIDYFLNKYNLQSDKTTLEVAAIANKPDVFIYLANIMKPKNAFYINFLNAACRAGNVEMIEFFLNEAKISANNGMLRETILSKKPAAVKALLELGNITPDTSNLHLASQIKDAQIEELLTNSMRKKLGY